MICLENSIAVVGALGVDEDARTVELAQSLISLGQVRRVSAVS